ncbi:SDR family NAD(P)-dependent oxidoreductase [Pseudomonas aeruginosa]|uniref:SDR family NAD(P)-dependent oxidoreductase n=1 Tax=Pseudomonas aeruginosa TaxID=287 RepID=UPI0003B94B8B|nr:SDR family NAD(P)-dependent oxidoreductase [Pseudomonas aeruginosa]KEA27604.1 short-chain dehydrogenase [Pseudomonas aeruginosa C2773C]EJM8826844.1 SDR family oxidoreductase [Pseudomonas aeruginosa]EKT8061467.1 SDR family oxidoreductase [Pseudomonas aeruginosa]EKU7998595.1 SDR family oxidoreductase [Pseudomonas aeruginosa]EKU8275014.1 SDR family oxidoreductase [Pseudomonas aeruginosa]
MRFQNKVVVVTGGAGGVGQALVRLFAKEGAKLMISDLNAEGCQAMVAEAQRLGAEAEFLAGNLREKEYCEALIARAAERFGGLDILLNNAGIIPRGTIEETTDDMWFTALDVNLTAVFFLCRAAIPHMKQRGGGAIVNTSSVWGVYPGPGHVAYCTSKGAVAALTKNMGRDAAPFGIRVNAVCPHEINTPMIRTGFARRGLDPDKAIEELNRTVPLGRIAEPEDIADVIAFLASNEARYIAAETLEVTGAKPVSG